MTTTAFILVNPSLEIQPETLAETVVGEWRAPAHTVVKRVELRIYERLSAHFSQFLHTRDLSMRDKELISEAEAFLLRKILERSV